MNETPGVPATLVVPRPAASIVPTQRSPLQVTFDVPNRSNRFWAIPILGFVAKYVILIPHMMVVGVLGMVVSLLQLFLWIPVLFTGRFPEWAFNLTTGYLRWSACVWAYFFGLTDKYPLFQLGETEGLSSRYPVHVEFERQTSYSRFWAIPLLGILVKWIILIPHFLVLAVLGIVIGILQLVLWIPVLFTGRFPQWGFGLVAGFVRWYTRLAAYSLGVTDQYPPFALDPT